MPKSKNQPQKPRTRQRRRTARSNAQNILGQGAVAVPTRAFGDSGTIQQVNRRNIRSMLLALNARLPRVLGLPRAVAPYSVIRTTSFFSTNAPVIIFTPVVHNGGSPGGMTNICALASQTATSPMSNTTNTKPYGTPLLGLGAAAEVTPSAMTVQIMNPEALQTTQGVIAVGRMAQGFDRGGRGTRTWEDFGIDFTSYFAPRILSAGRLALRGVTCSAMPVDMGQYSEFQALDQTVYSSSSNITWDEAFEPYALTPIVVYQSGFASPISLAYMVTTEWRIRFDPGNVAAATHTYHPTLPDRAWDALLSAASSMGHGVEDIADVVADAGAAAAGVGLARAGAVALAA